MAVQGISGLGITGTLSNGEQAIIAAQEKADESRFMSLIQEMTREKNAETPAASESVETVASSQIASNHRLKDSTTIIHQKKIKTHLQRVWPPTP